MIIFKGNSRIAYRDPACYWYDGVYHLFFSVSEKEGGYMFNTIAVSRSTDLKSWSEPRSLTPKDRMLNYCSPGNIIGHDGEFVLCFCSYPMPVPFEECWMADDTARLFTMRTKDFEHFTEPRLLNPKNDMPQETLGRMIDPYILPLEDGYGLFFKQNGVSFSRSKDLEHWEFVGTAGGGENACVVRREKDYLLIHSPENGIAFSRSADLKSWELLHVTTLEQDSWDWAAGRLTAGFAMEAPNGFPYRYILFFHGSDRTFPETHGNSTLAMAFTDDFINFVYEI